MKKNDISDVELDRMLLHASRPQLPDGALDRMADRMAAELQGNVVAFPSPKNAPVRSLNWLAGLPLAASLAFGIYLGSFSAETTLLPDIAYDYLNGAGTDVETGIEEAETLAEEDVT